MLYPNKSRASDICGLLFARVNSTEESQHETEPESSCSLVPPQREADVCSKVFLASVSTNGAIIATRRRGRAKS
jgi:hypothetical protein